MTVLDERGRVGGRLNAVDAAAAVVILLLMPLAVGGYLLFRTPPPTLSQIAPATLVEGPNQRIEIGGENLRPFMRVTLDAIPANGFLLGSTKYALVDLPPLKPGTYDVVLYDYAREVARLPKALTVAPMPGDFTIEIDGVFKAPADAFASQLNPGTRFGPGAELVAVGPAVAGHMQLGFGDEVITVPQIRQEVPATLRVTCTAVKGPDGVARCAVTVGDDRVIIAPAVLLTLPTAHGPVVFQVSTARASKR